ncbi:MAG: Ig-like domain-containing protein [Bacteroidota bacterium]|nr:Ig-like domain-containing protein [Bacteroidota bacterium]
MKQIRVAAWYIFALLLLHSCANRVAPTGGPKDLEPPILLSASPPNFQTNFVSKKVTLTFNEYVQLKDIQKQVIISPPISPAPVIELRKKSVVITPGDSLRPNTTYTINFGNALSDFTEGNSLPGFQYVFSTGSILDSLIISGTLIDAPTMKPMKEALAMVYEAATPDSVLGIIPPVYYARANEFGLFTIRNVRQGTYRLVGLADKNNNLTVDFAEESIGSNSEIVDLKDSVFVRLYLSMQQALKQKVKSSLREAPGKLVTVFARPVQSLKWEFLTAIPTEVIAEFSSYRDTVILYGLPAVEDSAVVIWTENNDFTDTVVYRNDRSEIRSKIKIEKKLSGSVYPPAGGPLLPETVPYVYWSSPLKTFDFTKVIILKDSVALLVTGSFFDSLQLKTNFIGSWKEGSYSVEIPPGTAEDRYGRLNDSIRFSFTVPGERSGGSISVVFNPASPQPLLLQLVNEKDEIVRQRNTSGPFNGLFEQVDPGSYRLRVVYDSNNNGRWDAGDIRNKLLPEKILYNADPITVRSNWEVEVEWTVQQE